MLRSPLLSNTQATRGARDALVRPYGNGALSTCSRVNASAKQQTCKRTERIATQRKVFTARDFNRARVHSKIIESGKHELGNLCHWALDVGCWALSVFCFATSSPTAYISLIHRHALSMCGIERVSLSHLIYLRFLAERYVQTVMQ